MTHRRSNYPPLDFTKPGCPRATHEHQPLFKQGDIVRYSDGPTALFQIETVIPNYGGGTPQCPHRYYGRHCLGGMTGRYEYQIEAASEADLQTWEDSARWRK